MAREIAVTFALGASLKGGFKSAFQDASASARNVAHAIRSMEQSSTGKLGASLASQREKIRNFSGSLNDARKTLSALQAQAHASGGATGILARQIELAEKRVAGFPALSSASLRHGAQPLPIQRQRREASGR